MHIGLPLLLVSAALLAGPVLAGGGPKTGLSGNLPTTLLLQGARHAAPRKAPSTCLAPRTRADVAAYFRQLSKGAAVSGISAPDVSAPGRAAQTARAGIRTCITIEVFDWTQPDEAGRVQDQWFAAIEKMGAQIQWQDLSSAEFTLFGLTYSGQYYFLRRSNMPGSQLIIIATK